MKKSLKKLCATICTISLMLNAISVLGAGYDLVKTTDMVFTFECDVKEKEGAGEEFHFNSKYISLLRNSLLSNYKHGYFIVYEDCETINDDYSCITTSKKQRIVNLDGEEKQIGDFDTIGTDAGGGFGAERTHYSAGWETGIDEFGGVVVTKDGKYGYYGLVDNVIIPCEYDHVITRYDENVFGVRTVFAGGYYINKEGEQIFTAKGTYTHYVGRNIFKIETFREKLANGLYDGYEIINEYVDTEGNVYDENSDIIQKIKDEQNNKHDNVIESDNPELAGIRGATGLFVVNSNRHYARDYNTWDKQLSGKYGILDKKGNIIVPYDFDIISGAQDGYCWASKDGVWSLLKVNTDEVTVEVDGEKIEFDQIPLVINGRTLAPLRAIFEKLGAQVEWDDATQTITSTKDETTIRMSVGNNEMIRNDEIITLDEAPQLVGERTLVPVRAIAEAFKCEVEWDDETSTVSICK